MQPTPLAASKTGAILSARICYNDITIYQGGAADGQPVGRVLAAQLSRSRMALYGAFTKERGTAAKERIERGMKARCATWFRLVLSQPRVVQAPVVLK